MEIHGKCAKKLLAVPLGSSPPAPGKPAVKIAVIDTGVDPYYGYFATGSNGTVFNPAYDLTSTELNDFQSGDVGIPFDYGAQIQGNSTDDNDSCLDDDFYGYDYFHKNNNPADAQGHGTHIAGTIMTGQLDSLNNIRIMPLQFGGYEIAGDTSSAFSCDLFAGLCAINYATNNGADVINLSWGYYSNEVNAPLERELFFARAADIVVVASTGNDGVSIDSCQHWPSNFRDSFPENMLAVAALDSLRPDSTMGIASYSNTGTKADCLAASGTQINSARIGTVFGYVNLSGTSMAAAVISRRAAMLRYLSAGAPRSDAATVKQQIMDETVTDPNICTLNNRKYDYRRDSTLLTAIGYY